MAIQVCEMLNLDGPSASTIRTWAERGKVKKYGLDQYGHQKYELTDIIKLIQAAKQPAGF